jgi:hypothetical protein
MTDQADLVETIAHTLNAKSGECRECILRHVQGAKARVAQSSKVGLPGAIKKKAAVLRASLEKTVALSRDPFFLAVLEEPEIGVNRAELQRVLGAAIAAASFIERQVIVPKGSKQKNPYRYESKSIAIALANQFSRTWGTERASAENTVASLIYELLTGGEDADITESIEDLKPPFIQTRRLPRR